MKLGIVSGGCYHDPPPPPLRGPVWFWVAVGVVGVAIYFLLPLVLYLVWRLH